MKLNIFFLTIDSLRADKIYGPNKSSFTPNIDRLIDKGIHFTQAISTSDATGLSLGSIFTAAYPFKTGITHFNYDSDIPNYLDLLKKNGYHLYATVPDVSFFLKLTADFTERDTYVYDKRDLWVQLAGGIGNSIVNMLENKLTAPWAYFAHLMDLHAPFYLPTEFDLEKYGKTRYDRMVSAIDYWIGKFLQKIDLEKTIIVLSADHGDYIPVIDNVPKIQTKFHNLIKKGKKTFPALEPAGLKIFTIMNYLKKLYTDQKLQKQLTKDDLRTLDSRGQWHLYDELVKIPLIFSGAGITSKKVTSQVRQVDIFPTIVDYIGIPNLQGDLDGKSLMPIINGAHGDDVAYIETGSRDPKKLGNIVGIRTARYKYLRSRNDPKSHVGLFDLVLDPSEKTNLAELKPHLVKEMESLLLQISKSHTKELGEMTDEETKKIQEELRKLGYL